MDADEHVLGAGDVALDHRDVVLVVEQRAVADRGELAERGRQLGRDDPLDQLLGAPAVGDQVGDRDHLQPVALAVGDQVRHPGHGPVVVHDLADHARPGLSPARRARSTAASVWPARSSTPPSLARSGNTWPGLHQRLRRRAGVDRDLDRVGAVGGGDPGGDALARLDRDRERGLQRRLVLRRHQVEPELVAALAGERQADQAAPLLGHEVDRLRGRELGRHRQVALVLARLVVADDDHPPAADVVDRLLDRGEGGSRLRSQLIGFLSVVEA